MTGNPSPRPPSVRLSSVARSIVAALALLILAGAAAADERLPSASRSGATSTTRRRTGRSDGSIDAVSVDLWRRAAEVMGRRHRFVPVSQMGVDP
jgi:hypothetical protein